ncbi:hypothetical protein HED54_19225 [Ochrobactrum anthropi ATCC 49188]|nr:hypothetical protein [Brucella anthropi ATCC 49188]
MVIENWFDQQKSNAQGDGGGANIKNAKKRPMPSFVKPELATLVSVAPDGNRWLHEIKFDGYRIQAHIAGARSPFIRVGTGLD